MSAAGPPEHRPRPSRSALRVLIAAGGTGGHVMPGLALARALQERAPGTTVTFAGTRRGIETRVVRQAGFHLDLLPILPLSRRLSIESAASPFAAGLGTMLAWRLVRERRADVVVGMGGYVTLPVALGAHLAGVPVLLHEQNAVPGLANRLAARVAVTVAVGIPEATDHFPLGRAVPVGNPVRPELARLDRASARAEALHAFGLAPDRRTLLVFGGSQGARRINQALVAATELWPDPWQLQILHACGRRDEAAVREAWTAARPDARGLLVRVVPFIERMDLAYAAADLALTRSGAITVAELTATGTPAVLVPLPYATAGHQAANAQALARGGGAVVVNDAELDGQALVGAVAPLLADPERLARMAERMREMARPTAAEDLADMVIAVARHARQPPQALPPPAAPAPPPAAAPAPAAPPPDAGGHPAAPAGVAVAGSHGKTTTAALIALTLQAAGQDPSYSLGGELISGGQRHQAGTGPHAVLEVGDVAGALPPPAQLPAVVVVTGVEPDPVGPSQTATWERLRRYLAGLPPSATAVLRADDPGAGALVGAAPCRVITYGLDAGADVHATGVELAADRSTFTVVAGGQPLDQVELPVPGRHNVANALGAVAAALALGAPFWAARRALRGFAGVARNLQLLGEVDGITLADDAAGHPTRVAAVLEAAALGRWHRVIAVFQPPGDPATVALAAELGRALAKGAQGVVVTDAEPAAPGGPPPLPGRPVAEAALRSNPGLEECLYIPDRGAVARGLAPRLRPGDLVLTLGAPGIASLGGELRELLAQAAPGEGPGAGVPGTGGDGGAAR